MALGLGVFFGGSTELTAEKRSPQHGQTDLDRQNRKSDQREQPAVDQHHRDVNHGKGGIQDGGEGLTGEEVADLLQFRHTSPEFTHRATVEIVQGQPQQVIDHLSPEALIDPVGGFCKQKGLEAAEHPFQDRYHHKGNAQHLQGVEAALADYFVDDHLDQQRVGQGEQLHHKTGGQHLNQNAAVALQSGPEPTGAELLIRRAVGPFHQQQFDPLRELLGQIIRRQGHHALLGRGQLEPPLVAGNHQRESPLPGQHRRHLQPGAGSCRHP